MTDPISAIGGDRIFYSKTKADSFNNYVNRKLAEEEEEEEELMRIFTKQQEGKMK